MERQSVWRGDIEVSDPPRVQDPRLDGPRAIARLLDEAIEIPGTSFRVGLDALIGLIPGIGDIAGGAVSAWLIVVANRLGAPRSVLLRMLWNILVDVAIGTVPFLGDLFDLGWKANSRNVRLLERYVDAPSATRRSSRWVVAAILLVLAGAIAGSIALVALVIGALF